MTTYELSLLTTIILIFPMLYFLMVTPTFLLRPLSDPIVARLLRGLFNVYFLVVSTTCSVAVMAFLLANRPVIAIGIASVAALALVARRWFLSRMDGAIGVQDVVDLKAASRLRRLHCAGMAYNAIQLSLIVASISWIFPAGS